MPPLRNKGPFWDHVEAIGSKDLSKCLYCGKEFHASAWRIEGHLAAISGRGVTACPNVPETVKEFLKEKEATAQKTAAKKRTLDHFLQVASGTPGSSSISTSSEVKQHKQVCICPIVTAIVLSNLCFDLVHCVVLMCSCNSKGHQPTFFCMSCKVTGQTKLKDCYSIQDRKDADAALALACYTNGLSFRLFRDPYFIKAIQTVAKLGPTYKAPGSELVRTRLLSEEVARVDAELKPIRSTYEVYGCTITSDGWSSVAKRPLLNVLVVSPKGAEFVKAIDTSGESKTGRYIADQMKPVIEKVGANKVVQIVMDNASSCQTAKELLEEEYPDIYCTNCSSHVLDLLLEDIGKELWAKNVHRDANSIVNFFNNHPMCLSFLRSRTELALIKPADTRFAFQCIIGERLLEVRDALEDTVSCSDFRSWMQSDGKRRESGK